MVGVSHRKRTKVSSANTISMASSTFNIVSSTISGTCSSTAFGTSSGTSCGTASNISSYTSSRTTSVGGISHPTLAEYEQSSNELDGILSKVRAHDVVSWAALIVAYTQHRRNRAAGQGESLECASFPPLEKLQRSALATSSLHIPQAGASAKDAGESSDVGLDPRRVHAPKHLDRLAANAIQVFHALPRRSLFSWNFIIAAFAKNRHVDAEEVIAEESIAGDNVGVDSPVGLPH
ncbi:hypothetical protein SELMODRAFT_417042 [Selaginella moellendorffii]|uniref:Uncharacterized protein n=1 Tax=Selaginella moellendorffii TaxID=88036 RepID=D8S167_SELML|nr:hypothetical protein SELMODRAFT_417042 [Selaginella moellendorffii]